MSLHDKHVVITGASAGIGAELARQLAARGCQLTLAARRMELLEAVAAECRNAGAAAMQTFQCDVTNRDQLAALVDHARALGEIDVWVNNAGSGLRHRLLEATDEDMLDLYRLHVLAPLHSYQLVAPAWIAAQHRGQFVDICSVGGKAGYPFNAAYAAAKHALSGLSDTARLELAPHGISVTTAYPGATVSDFSVASLDRTDGKAGSYVRSNRESRSFLRRRIAQPQSAAQVAAAIVRGIEHRSPTVFPHRWGNFALVVWHLAPRYVVGAITRALRPQTPAEP